MKRTYFGNIVVHCKLNDNSGDFRAFAHVRDSSGDWWELRGYGKTAGEAADDAWRLYKLPEDDWEYHGYTIDPPK